MENSELMTGAKMPPEAWRAQQDNIPPFKEYVANIDRMAKLYASLAAAQGEFPEIPKNRHVKIRMKSGGEYEFRYADLQEIISKTKGPLSKHGLSVIQLFRSAGKETILTTMLGHAAGGLITSDITLPVPSDNDPKTLGALQTYFRRYAYSALVGVSADDDLDSRDTKAEVVDTSDPAIAEMTAAAELGTEAYKKYWVGLTEAKRKQLKALHPGMKLVAAKADKEKAVEAPAAGTPADPPGEPPAGEAQ